MWQVIGASVPGTSHTRSGLPCQDAHGWRVAGQHVVLAVADGLGSASMSGRGARLAVEGALGVVAPALAGLSGSAGAQWADLLSVAFAQARDCLVQAALVEDIPVRELATTLLIAVAGADGFATGQIGDGAMVAMLADGALAMVSAPQRGEYANEIMPLTAEDALASVSVSVRPERVKSLALLTDGLQNLSLNAASGAPHEPFFMPFIEAVLHQRLDGHAVSAQLADFLACERVCARTDDDKTLLVAGWFGGNGGID
ncbi:MAG: protein phosphatase 2C domain-containing protein [Betaproteobacteria bacterium]|nr:protein phosphatase 2C domain-containing protein [Betaproteobacteria bacterium]